MASPRYTWNIPPEAPGEEQHEMTAKQKRENFWFYHKWHVIGGVAAVALAAFFIKDVVLQVHPDYSIALLSTQFIPTGVSEKLGEALAPYFDDRNGDGKTVVEVLEYNISADGSTADPNVQMAGVTRLMGDIDNGTSMLYLTDDLAFFEEQYGLFAYDDGTAPAEGEAADLGRMGLKWADSAALKSLDLGKIEYFDGGEGMEIQKYLDDFTLVPRLAQGTKIEKKEKLVAYYEDTMEIYQTLAGR